MTTATATPRRQGDRDSPLAIVAAARWVSGLGDPAHRVAPAELLDAVLAEREHDQRAPVGGEGEHVRDHPAVGEDLGRLAQRVDERVVEAAGSATSRTWLRYVGPSTASRSRIELSDSCSSTDQS